MIAFQAIDVSLPSGLNESVADWIERVIGSHKKKTGEVFFLFCSDDFLYRMNVDFLNHDTYTDIITFNNSNDEEIISGEMYISIDRIVDNAKNNSQTIENEMYRVIIHGVLHLLGFDDKTVDDIASMRRQEEISLSLHDFNVINQ